MLYDKDQKIDEQIIHYNMVSMWRDLANNRPDKLSFRDTNGFSYIIGTDGSPVVNSILTLPENPSDTLHNIYDDYKEQCKQQVWWVNSKLDETYCQMLDQKGLSLQDKVTGMIMKLRKSDLQGDRNIVEVSSHRQFDDWMIPFTKAFSLSCETADYLKQIIISTLNNECWHHYILLENMLPVAVLSMFIDHKQNVAGIYNGATLESARRKGHLSKLCSTAIRDAMHKNCKYIVAVANSNSKNAFFKLGFTEGNTYNLYF